MLTDKIRFSGPGTEDPEDILSSALGVIFPDDINNQHGDASTSVIYLSPSYGPLHLELCNPSHESRSLFSHFLWNASLQIAEFVEEGEGEGIGEGEGKGERWVVEGTHVLELGAGTGLAGLVAALRGARRVVLSDYPAVEVLENLRRNIEVNISGRKQKQNSNNENSNSKVPESGGQELVIADVTVQGHEWGVPDDEFSLKNREAFDRILVADCLWMPWQHGNLLRSISWFLARQGRAWVVAGFHTGREKMRGFFEEERLTAYGLRIHRIWERDAEGKERVWVTDRGREDVTERKRWLVIAVLERL